MSELITWGPVLLGYAEEIITGGVTILGLILGAAGVLLAKAQKIKKEFIELIDYSDTPNKEFEKLAENKGLKIARKLIKWFPRKTDH